MRTSLFVLSLVLAAAPSYAGGKAFKKSKKFLVCAVLGEQTAEVGVGKDAAQVDISAALDAGAEALAAELEAAGIGIVPYSEAAAAAKALQARFDKAEDKKLGAKSKNVGEAIDMGGDPSKNPALAAAMNNPGLTPEQRAQMAQALGNSGGFGAATGAKMAAGYGDLAQAGRKRRDASVVHDGSPSTGFARRFCPVDVDDVPPDEAPDPESLGGGSYHFEFLDSVGADGWLFVDARFGGSKSSRQTGTYTDLVSTTFVPKWTFNVRTNDKKGRQVWKNRNPIMSKNVEIGKTVGSAKKAITASAPDAFKALVAELTD